MPRVNIPGKLLDKLREEAEKLGVPIEGLIIERLGGTMDPKSGAMTYWEASQQLLKEAEEELHKGDLRQASEKMWGAAALAVKAAAYLLEGRRLRSHSEIREYVVKLAGEKLRDEDVRRLFQVATSMHINFYENWAPREEVEGSLRDVREFLDKIAAIILAENL